MIITNPACLINVPISYCTKPLREWFPFTSRGVGISTLDPPPEFKQGTNEQGSTGSKANLLDAGTMTMHIDLHVTNTAMFGWVRALKIVHLDLEGPKMIRMTSW